MDQHFCKHCGIMVNSGGPDRMCPYCGAFDVGPVIERAIGSFVIPILASLGLCYMILAYMPRLIGWFFAFDIH